MTGETRLRLKLVERSKGETATECGAVLSRAEQEKEKEELTAHLISGGVVVVVVVVVREKLNKLRQLLLARAVSIACVCLAVLLLVVVLPLRSIIMPPPNIPNTHTHRVDTHLLCAVTH